MDGKKRWGTFVVLVVLAACSSSGSSDEGSPSTSRPVERSTTTAPSETPASGDELAGRSADGLAPFSPLVSVGGELVAYRTVVDEVLHTVVVDVSDRSVRWSVAEPVNRIRGVPMPPVTYLSAAGLVVVLSDESGSGARQALRRSLAGSSALAIQGRDPATGAVRWSAAVPGSPSDFPGPCEDGGAACLLVEAADGTTELFVHAGTDGALDRRPGGFERVIVAPTDRDGHGLELTIDGQNEPYPVTASADYRRRPLWTSDLRRLRGDAPVHPDGGWFAVIDGGRIPALWLGPREFPEEPGEAYYGAVIGLGPDGEVTYLLDDAGPCYALSDAQTFALCDYATVDDGEGGIVPIVRAITMFDLDTGALGDRVRLDPPFNEFDPQRRAARLDGRRWIVDTGSGWALMDLDSRTITPADPAQHPHGWCTPPEPDEPVVIETEGQGVAPHSRGDVLEPCAAATGERLSDEEVTAALGASSLSDEGMSGSIVTTDVGSVWTVDGRLAVG